MEETGVVVETRGEEARVKIERKPFCDKCRLCLVEEGGMFILAKNSIGAKVGDRVTLRIPKGKVAQASILLFFLPVVGLLTGLALGRKISSPLYSALFLGMGLFFLPFLFFLFYEGSLKKARGWEVKIVKIQPPGEGNYD